MAKLFQSKAYQVIVSYIYGWGACAVIIGALFKIMHFPGAGVILTVGMLVEAFIFFVSVFEPPMEHYDWTKVYPELASGHGDKQRGKSERKAVAAKEGNVVNVAGSVDLGLDEADINKLREGINKIAVSADNFAEVSVNVPEFARKISDATASFGQLGEKTHKVGEMLENSVKDFSDGCGEINKILLDSSRNLTDQIKLNCEKLASNMGVSAGTFEELNKAVDEQMRQVKFQSESYTQQMSAVNKNISALNALYELQINETKDCLESFRGMQGDMTEMLEHVSLSVDNAKLFKQESQQLATNVASLNSVYGNMLSVVNNN
ncbi:gliding motility protein GldL [Odoribacter lunatus]|uniref:type IX secretion system motor protein PorL/GldL n=1 Tax=Odoribacter lunatus TaxID=2941335 RepID=UPI00204178AE|nr:gliding motility protein GldL [Odoribacter lunatus]